MYRVQQDTAGCHVAIARVGRLDDVPGRPADIGCTNGAVGHGFEELVLLAEFRLFWKHLPAAAVAACQGFQPLALVLLREVIPALDDYRTVMNQHAFELANLMQVLVQVGIGPVAGETLLYGLLVPAPEEHADVAATGHDAPEPPGLRSVLFFVSLVPEGVHVHTARIQPFVQGIHYLALAGTLHTGDEHIDRDSRLTHCKLGVQQLRSQIRFRGLEVLFAQRASDFRAGKHVSPFLSGQ